MELRDYQLDIYSQVVAHDSNDIVQLDTGAGKTPIEAALAQWAPHVLLVAHRNILIQQISEKLAAFGLEHDTISTEHTRRRCIAAHRAHGRSFIVRGHSTRLVASMQSIEAAIRHHRFTLDATLSWLIVIDEAHHVVPGNMWGQLRTLFPNARIVGFTATPARMDGESLHVAKGGLFDRLVQASTLGNDSAKALIDRGYLSGFRAFMPTHGRHYVRMRNDARYAAENAAHDERWAVRGDDVPEHVNRAVKGLDWSMGKLTLAADPVEEYKRLAMGTRAIMMAPSIKNAELFAVDFRAAGVPAACISSTQSPAEISRVLDAFRTGQCLVLTNVDMVGEGFDLPACETLIIATRTASFPRYRQWCGRVLRPDASKKLATIIDLTGMLAEHGLPDEPVRWDLLNPPCGPMSKRYVPCDQCGAFFPFRLAACPECGWANAWQDRPDSYAPGTYQFDIRTLDPELVGFVRCERRMADAEKHLSTVLQRPPDGFGSDLFSRTITKLAAWFPQRLIDGGVSIRDVNRWLASSDARDRGFYMRHFTAASLKSTSSAAALKAYKAWLKQQSSTATQRTTDARAG